MKTGANIIHAADQDGIPMLWAEVDDTEGEEDRTFCVIGTGWPVPEEDWTYLGTYQYDAFVWHIYEVPQ